MELFFLLIEALVAGGAYFHSRNDPNVWANTILFLMLIILGVSLYTTGITLPNTGVSYSGSTATFTGTTYTMDNTPIVFGASWLLLVLGIVGLGWTVGIMAGNKVDSDGRIH